MGLENIELWVGGGVFAVALVFGVAGSAVSVVRAKGPRERAFALRACLIMWVLVALLLVSMVWLPAPYTYIVVAVYLFLFPYVIFRLATLHQLIRVVDQREGRNGDA